MNKKINRHFSQHENRTNIAQKRHVPQFYVSHFCALFAHRNCTIIAQKRHKNRTKMAHIRHIKFCNVPFLCIFRAQFDKHGCAYVLVQWDALCFNVACVKLVNFLAILLVILLGLDTFFNTLKIITSSAVSSWTYVIFHQLQLHLELFRWLALIFFAHEWYIV